MVYIWITIATVSFTNIENTLLIIKLSMTVMDDMEFSTVMLDNPLKATHMKVHESLY